MTGLHATHCKPLHLWAVQFSTHLIVHLPRPHFIHLLWETILKAFTKVKINNIHIIIEGYQVVQVWFLLTGLNYPLLHHMFQKFFQDYFLHHLPRDWGEAAWPAVPQILLLALLENEWQETPSCHDFSKIIESGLIMTLSSSFSTHRVHPIRFQGLYVHFV